MRALNKGFTLIRTIRKDLIIVQRGFTLIELLVVISIIGILIALSVFGLQGARKSARDAQRKTDLQEIRSGIEIYKADCGDYPDSPLSFGGSLVGSCPTSNTYIQTVPNDPLPDRVYSYQKTGIGTYILCATLEQGGQHCVYNP